MGSQVWHTLAQAGDWGDHMDWDGGGWIVMGIGMVLFWALVIVGVVWLVRSLTHDHRQPAHSHPRDEEPIAVLDRRLAEGSIDVDDYERRKRTLRGDTSR
jgi:putative membrane protein